MKTIHEDAILDSDRIGNETTIWRAHIMEGARVGRRCMLADGVHVGPDVSIGDGCRIQNGAQLFAGVTLEDNVFIGPHVVFTNVAVPRAFVKRAAAFSPTLVKRGGSIGANATIICGVTIGEYAMVGAGAVVTKDVPAYTLTYGNPAIAHRWVCACGEILPPVVAPTDAHVTVTCPACNAEYTASLTEGLRAKTPA